MTKEGREWSSSLRQLYRVTKKGREWSSSLRQLFLPLGVFCVGSCEVLVSPVRKIHGKDFHNLPPQLIHFINVSETWG